jgi:hypothetical protein
MTTKNKPHPEKLAEDMALLDFLKEKDGERLTRIEAYLDLMRRASTQYVPKDLCKQEFTLHQNQCVITLSGLAEIWHWHRATVRTFLEQLEQMNRIQIIRLTRSEIVSFEEYNSWNELSPIEQCLEDFEQKLSDVLARWKSGDLSTKDCGKECERLYNASCKVLATGDGTTSTGEYAQNELRLCLVMLGSICQASLQNHLSEETADKRIRMVDFFRKDLAGDYESLLDATKALAELVTDEQSSILARESPAVREKFRQLCKPFVCLLANKSAVSFQK